MLRERAGQAKIYPTSDPQRRLWFFEQLEPGSSVYNNCIVLDLVGDVDLEALEGALRAIVARHDTLRTTFSVVDGLPVQVVASASDATIVRVDLVAEPAAAREAELERRLDEEARRPFALTQGPLFRALWVRTDEDRGVLALTIHHIVSDGWSLLLLLRELATAYADCVAHRPVSLPPLPLQYGEHALVQQERLGGQTLTDQLAFWRSVLGGDISPLELPTDAPRPRVQSYRGRSQSVALSDELAGALRQLSRNRDVTLFMTLLAAFGMLLGRLCGRDVVTVGAPIAGRTRAEVEGLIGFFVNTLPMRVDFSGDPSFEELVARVGRMAKGAYANQEVPFDRLVDELHVERDLSRTPLFQVLLNMLNFSAQTSVELPGLRIALRSIPQTTSKFDVTVYVATRGEGLTLSAMYNADLFGETRMRELLAQFVFLLEQVAKRPDLPVAAHSLVTGTAATLLPDRAQPLSAPGREALPALLSRRAGDFRDRVALEGPAGSWSYGQLEARACRLAHRLLGAGLRRGQVVGVYARRDPLLVCCLLGINKAGGAFAILDPAYPAARLAACWNAAAPAGLIALEGAGEPGDALEAELRRRPMQLRFHLSLSALDGEYASLPAEDPGLDLRAEDPAYVNFTSGTTGGAKAVLGTHGPLVHFLDWHTRTFALGPDDRFALLSGLSHDPLLRDVLTPLWVGASLQVPDPGQVGEPGWLASWLSRQGVTIAHLTPAMSELVRSGAGEQQVGERLRLAFFAGDVLTRRTVRRFLEFAPNATCVNFYGATETPQAMAYHVVARDPEDASDPASVVPVGRGIDDVQLLVQNARGGAAGVGELGEIVVRTPHLAAGYLGDEELTHERFVSDPFPSRPGDRVYRTGDLGRYRPDGAVEFAGRADTQVKVRGFRVELGEIEAALREHAGVEDVAVLAREAADADLRLVAYVVRAGRQPPETTALRQHVATRLPSHMIPSSFVFLPSLPLTPNGKVDRRALPILEGQAELQQKACVAPRTATEKAVARIWGETLSPSVPVGVDDNFFDLGGHSFSAARLIAALRSAFEVDVGLRTLFERPTIAGLSEAIDLLLLARRVPQVQSAVDREEFEF